MKNVSDTEILCVRSKDTANGDVFHGTVMTVSFSSGDYIWANTVSFKANGTSLNITKFFSYRAYPGVDQGSNISGVAFTKIYGLI